jgi:hypothetical protein
MLMLNLLRGLNNPHFFNTEDNIAKCIPSLLHHTACNMLTLKELRLANKGKVSLETALMTTSSSCRPRS